MFRFTLPALILALFPALAVAQKDAAVKAAGVAVAEQLKAGTIKGTVRFYGCPAEEGGAAKAFMARAGLFDDCDTVFHWHPGSRNAAGDSSCLARIAVKFRYHGTASHAAGSP